MAAPGFIQSQPEYGVAGEEGHSSAWLGFQMFPAQVQSSQVGGICTHQDPASPYQP